MGNQMSPGVEVNEIDLTIIVPMLGNATAAFAGEFTRGPSDKYLLVTNPDELISNYGYPTNDNANDWFQAYNYLQYANKLLISRAVDANGSWSMTTNTVATVNEPGKVEVNMAPTEIQVGSYVRFAQDAEDEYKVKLIEPMTNAVAQVDTITIIGAPADAVADGVTFAVTNNGSSASYTTSGGLETTSTVAAQLGSLIELVDTNATNVSVSENVITVTASVAGQAMSNVATQGASLMTIVTITDNVESEFYELVFEEVDNTPVVFDTIALANAEIYIKDSAMNAICTAPKVGANAKNAADLKAEAMFISNEVEYEIQESSIAILGDDKLKFMAKSSGSEMNGIEIAIGREADFTVVGGTEVFPGLYINDYFENKPLDGADEIAVLVRKDGEVTGAYVVSLIPGSKDYRNKSNYIEDIINKYDDLLFVKNNEGIVEMPESRLFGTQGLLFTSNGSDGTVSFGDIENAYGSVADNTIFGNKEELDVDIIIANEKARVQAGGLAADRADCIAFIGAKFDDVVGIKSVEIVANLIRDVQTGDLNSGNTANSFNAVFGNYKYQYDKFNDKFRWVSVAGDVAGLRADTNTKLNTWWASAGQILGSVA